METCNGGGTKFTYPSNKYYHPELTPLEKLHRHGINVDTGYVYPYRIVYDFEAMFKPIDKTSAKTTFYAEHVPLSVSIHFNVP